MKPQGTPGKRPSKQKTGIQTTSPATLQQPVAESDDLPAGYTVLLNDLKQRIRITQVKAALAINRELIGLYWHMGSRIAERQLTAGWGRSVVERLASDLRRAFPDVAGFSPSNLWRMRSFYLAWSEEILAQPVRELSLEPPREAMGLPWGHNICLVERVKDLPTRRWYAEQATAQGWSRAVLLHQIETDLHGRQGKALHNFERTLPPPQSDLAHQVLKDPYVLDFLRLTSDVKERELEQALINHVQSFLLELGVGFAFVGRQVRLEVGEQEFYLDLLFYHLKLRCFVVIELKATAFEPEFVGKMNFYLAVVDDKMRHPEDAPSIGLLLCKSKNKLVVEYALRDMNTPIGVAEWQTRLVESLPDEFKGNLPTVEELERELTGAASVDLSGLTEETNS